MVAGPETGAASVPPIFRPTARSLVLDSSGRALLFGGQITAGAKTGRTWFTPGGGIRAGETQSEAASRELAEETGLLVPPGEFGRVIAVCAGLWWAGRQPFFGVDSLFLVRTTGLDVDPAGHEEQERTALATHRWWSADELDATTDRVFPIRLGELLRTALTGRLPASPVRLPWREHRTSSQR